MEWPGLLFVADRRLNSRQANLVQADRRTKPID